MSSLPEFFKRMQRSVSLFSLCLRIDARLYTLLIEVNEVPLSRIMQNLQFRYTRNFNIKYGHLFQERCKAICVKRTHIS